MRMPNPPHQPRRTADPARPIGGCLCRARRGLEARRERTCHVRDRWLKQDNDLRAFCDLTRASRSRTKFQSAALLRPWRRNSSTNCRSFARSFTTPSDFRRAVRFKCTACWGMKRGRTLERQRGRQFVRGGSSCRGAVPSWTPVVSGGRNIRAAGDAADGRSCREQRECFAR